MIHNDAKGSKLIKNSVIKEKIIKEQMAQKTRKRYRS